MPSARPPNLLLTIADDQRFDLLGALGHPDLRTPALDALAARGTLFTRAHHMGSTHGAVCAPSRAMLHAGLPLYRIPNAIKMAWGGFTPDAPNPDPLAVPLLGELLRGRGYDCFGVGKWHNGAAAFNRSFDDGAAIFLGGMADPFATPLRAFDPTGRYATPLPAPPTPVHATDAIADAAVDYIRRYARGDRRKPFFLYCAFTAPHDPRTTHPHWHARYDPARLALPPNFMPEHPFDNGELRIRDELLAGFPRSEEEVRRHLADYYAMTAHLDDAIGRIHAALAEAGLADDTLRVHTADHGLAVGQHGLMGKQNLYDHSVRVPLLIAGPGFAAARRDDRLCYMHDLFPTLLQSAGVTPPPSELFHSLHDAPHPSRRTLWTAYTGCQRMVRDEKFKLIAYHVDGNLRVQLFDLAADPWELHDMAEEPASRPVVERLWAELRAWRLSSGDPVQWYV